MKEINAEKDFGVCDILVTPLNDDGSQPEIDNIIGGVGPFDFSGVSVITAVPFISKIDSGAAETVTIDLSPAVDQSAITVAELFAAINVATPSDLTASVEAETGRLKIAYSGSGSPSRVQVYGEAATLGMIGQGKGIRIVYIDTHQSITDSPTMKDDETFTVTTARGKDTDVVAAGYRKGVTGVITDTAGDYLLRSIIEGGLFDEVNEIYDTPTSENAKVEFKIESYAPRYASGSNKEVNIAKFVKTEVFSCTGTFGDRSKERGFTSWVYNFTATPWRDSDDNIMGDSKETQMTVSAYEALNLSDIVA